MEVGLLRVVVDQDNLLQQRRRRMVQRAPNRAEQRRPGLLVENNHKASGWERANVKLLVPAVLLPRVCELAMERQPVGYVLVESIPSVSRLLFGLGLGFGLHLGLELGLTVWAHREPVVRL